MSSLKNYNTLPEKERARIIKEIEACQVDFEMVPSYGASWTQGNDIISIKKNQQIIIDKIIKLNKILSSGVLPEEDICKIEKKEEQVNNKNEGVSIEIKDDNNETIVVPSSLQGKTQIISKPQQVVFNEVQPSWFR
jgi:hypothetical protein